MPPVHRVNPTHNFIRVLLLTLQRRDEVARMGWDELTPDLTRLGSPGTRSKNNRAHVVHLAEPVQAILRSMHRVADNPFVFAGRRDRPLYCVLLCEAGVWTRRLLRNEPKPLCFRCKCPSGRLTTSGERELRHWPAWAFHRTSAIGCSITSQDQSRALLRSIKERSFCSNARLHWRHGPGWCSQPSTVARDRTT